jgi:hypothetical protein
VDLSICDVCDDYCDIYDACDEYYDIYDVCDEYYGMHIMLVIFGIFIREKNCTLPCVQEEAHGKVTITAGGNSGLCRAFLEAHGKESILCRAFSLGRTTKAKSLSCIFLRAHGKGRPTPFEAGRRELLVFVVRHR